MMRRIDMRLVLAAVIVLDASRALASYINGAGDHVRQAEAVLVGHAQTVVEEHAWPAPLGQQRIVVEEVLAGVWFEQYIVVAGTALAPGQRAIVLERPRYIAGLVDAAITAPPAREPPTIWPLGPGDQLPPGIPLEGGDGGLVMSEPHAPITLAELRAIAAKVTPHGVGATARVIDAALVHPAPDPLAAIYDVARDVPTLAALLEARDPAVRRAALARLRAISHDDVAAPTVDTPRELAGWRQRWLDWWQAHHATLLAGRAYPAVPDPLVPPRIVRPAKLLAALDGDPARLGAIVVGWLDSGAMRDRELRGALSDEHASRWPGRDRMGLSYSDPTVLGSLEIVFDRSQPAGLRITALAQRLVHAHADRFAAERALAAASLATQPPCSDVVRRAAYWETAASGSDARGPANIALARLGECKEPRARELVKRALHAQRAR
jgi:hypothetical protein